MNKHLLFILLMMVGTATAVDAQNVFSNADPIVNFDITQPLGSAAHPNVPATGVMSKWGRTQNTSRINWNETAFKCYIWNNMAFRLRFPNNYNPANKYPVLLFFHGGGEASHDKGVYENEDQLFWGANDWQTRINNGEWNAFMLFPQQLQESSGGWDDSYFTRINNVLDTLQKYNNADLDRVVVMGLSEGGSATLSYASLYPQRTASIISSSPSFVSSGTYNTSLLQIPTYVADGGADNRPTPANILTFFEAFHNAGGSIYWSFYPTTDHGSWIPQWIQTDVNAKTIIVQMWNAEHKAQPVIYYNNFTNNTQFCKGSPISSKMGITAGFNAYQWQRGVNGVYADIPGATSNEYTATDTGTYRVRFQRVASGPWSDYSPNPVVISNKNCAIDTAFAEHFDRVQDYLYFVPSTPYKNWNGCYNGFYTTGTEFITAGPSGILRDRYMLNFTNSDVSTCPYAVGDKVWGTGYNGGPWNDVNVQPNTNYVYSYWLANHTTDATRAAIVPTITGLTTNATTTFATNQLGSSTNGDLSWTRFSNVWNSGTNTQARLSLLNNTTSTSGNNFAIDEVALTRLTAPGGVGGNRLMTWNKAATIDATDGLKFKDWVNNYTGKTLTQGSYPVRPILKDNGTDNINFNPLASFTSSQQINGVGGFTGATSHTAVHAYVVMKSNSITQSNSVLFENVSGTGAEVNVSLSNGGNVTWIGGASNTVTAAGANEVNKPILWSFSKDAVNNTPNGNKLDIRKNGIVVASGATSGSFTGNSSDFELGGFDGKIAEVVYYLDTTVTTNMQSRIESYLAIKYGLTLGTVASPANYLASDNTVFWSGVANPAYQNDVFGIGVDSASGFSQSISNSMNSGSGNGAGQSGKGNLVLWTNSTLLDKRFLVIGNDAGVMTDHVITAAEAPVLAQGGRRVNRKWRVDNTGNVGPVNISVDTTGYTFVGGSTLTNFGLMIDNDGDGNFNTGTINYVYATSGAGKKINFTNVTLVDNAVFTLITLRSPNSPLPATWLSFTATAVKDNAELSWKTSEEINVAYYAVEHSTNGVDFAEIGRVSAKNGSNVNDYAYTQSNLADGLHYYRLRRVDKDGQYGYSVVKTIRIASGKTIVQIRPNPVAGTQFTLAVSIQQANRATINITSMDGKILSRQQVSLSQGLNTIPVSVSNIPTGVYMLQVQINEEMISKKFVKVQ